jgi:hypothetical protein
MRGVPRGARFETCRTIAAVTTPLPNAAKPVPRLTTVGDTLAEAARRKPKPPAAKRWLWVILAIGAGICLAQLFGLTSSPVADRLKEAHRDDPKKDAAPADAGMQSGGGTTTPPAR